MGTIWIIGRKATIEANDHEYMTEPYIAYGTEAEADEACDLVHRISGERPMKAEVAYRPAVPLPAERKRRAPQ